MSWLNDIEQAMSNLGGISPYLDLYREVQRIRTVPLPTSWQAIIRRVIETNSSDSQVFDGKNDIFFSVEGLGNGVWGLRTFLKSTPKPPDIVPIDDREAARIKCETYRILRDTQLAREIKLLHKDQCQICGLTVQLGNGTTYSEAHHIKPLGSPHNGPDVPGNILILCPNHHVQCDYRFMALNIKDLRTHKRHNISLEYLAYHNSLMTYSV